MCIVVTCHIALYWTLAPAPFSPGTGARGQGAWSPGRDAVEAWPHDHSSRAGVSSMSGAACSGLFKLLFTIAYTEGLGLDTSPAGHEETA